MVQDYYKLLQISSDASVDLIHQQCQKIISHYNKYPEKYENIDKKIKKIQKIEVILSDSSERKKYDRLLLESREDNSDEKTKYCKGCGKKIPANSQFCKYCGENIISEVPGANSKSVTKTANTKQQNQQEKDKSIGLNEGANNKSTYNSQNHKKNSSFFDFSFIKFNYELTILWIVFISLFGAICFTFLFSNFGSVGILLAFIISFLIITKIFEIYYPSIYKLFVHRRSLRLIIIRVIIYAIIFILVLRGMAS